MEYILNTNTGILHTKPCADGELGLAPVAPGRRQHFNNLDNARTSDHYVKDHDHPECLGE